MAFVFLRRGDIVRVTLRLATLFRRGFRSLQIPSPQPVNTIYCSFSLSRIHNILFYFFLFTVCGDFWGLNFINKPLCLLSHICKRKMRVYFCRHTFQTVRRPYTYNFVFNAAFPRLRCKSMPQIFHCMPLHDMTELGGQFIRIKLPRLCLNSLYIRGKFRKYRQN